MPKIGRNDPCPCGSGKKYKHCCYGENSPVLRQVVTYDDADWTKIRRTEGDVVRRILGFALRRYGKEVFQEAQEEFGLWRG
jgi:hypothetical protein